MSALFSILMFVVVFTILVFVHELGHYAIARRNKIKIDVFSIGFGPEIFGWTDSHDTRWKVSWVPLGGYVKFFGDDTIAGGQGDDVAEMSEQDKAVSFHHKSLGSRAAVVAAGPITNLLFAIVVFAGLFAFIGQPYLAAKVGEVVPDSAAAAAGFEAGDLIVDIDGSEITRFADVQSIVTESAGVSLAVEVIRDNQVVALTVVPDLVEVTDNFGGVHNIGRLGIASGGVEILEHGPIDALWYATIETGRYMKQIMAYIGQLIVGAKSSEELGGPILIAQISGQAAEAGPATLLNFIAILSINLGLINLFPIPVLDGGHLLFYAFEGIRGKPLGKRAQEYGFRVGLAAVLTLTIFVTWQDLERLKVFEFFTNIFS